MKRVLIVGTGLIGASVGLALKTNGFEGSVVGWDQDAVELEIALRRGAIDETLSSRDEVLETDAEVIVLATPVLPILDWILKLGGVLGEGRLVTDVGSTKREIALMGSSEFNRPGRARFLAGHPMAGKELGGAALAEAELFRGATWLFCPAANEGELEAKWRSWVVRFGAVVRELDPERHDEVCAWVSHLPQMMSTALAALLEDTFAGDVEGMAMTNTEAIAATLSALEQRLAQVRENLRTPELRDEFATANKFRAKRSCLDGEG
jgi:prephenate dehydrogenase